MVSERIQRRINQLLDEADGALARRDWAQVRDSANAVLSLDPENADARTFVAAADHNLSPGPADVAQALLPMPPTPTSFANGRY